MGLDKTTPELFAALATAQSTNNPEMEAAALRAILRLPPFKSGRQHSFRPLNERIMERVVFGTTGCWHWLGLTNGKGYGRMTYQGRQQVAHRLAWMAWNGEIPEGLYVLHRCDNRACVNPEHLWLGTYSDNLQDCWNKGRHPGRGGKH